MYLKAFLLFWQKDVLNIVNKDPYNDVKEALIRIKKKQGLWKGLIQQISHSIEGMYVRVALIPNILEIRRQNLNSMSSTLSDKDYLNYVHYVSSHFL